MRTATPPLTAADAKRLATLQAAAAPAGWAVLVTEDDHGHPAFVASRWAHTRPCASLDDLAAFLHRVGVTTE